MKFWKTAPFALFLLIVPSTAFAKDRSCNSQEPINSINEMFLALDACWQPPKGTTGMSITLRFALRRDGTLMGKPQTTYSHKSVKLQKLNRSSP